ncbi:GspE/PulE family protein [Zooshikella ganghwensis]|uniref:Type II/IV secretion system protein n=1 Tax=Zooshikella ganghwensis TaxID=202772 RepID=A0A4P9VUJ1_9GAMM|nr:GspE/PulE family protein [Zooshikella ganghwensis]RDH46104.1 type II/IV secretion system protein [Zooshikella ganghwensis]
MTNEELERAVVDYILEKNLIPPQKLVQAKIITSYSDNLIYEVLYDLNLLSVDQLNKILSEVTGFPVIDPLYEINKINIPEEVLSLLPNELVLQYVIFPFRLEENTLFIAMSNPTDKALVDQIEKKAGYPVKRFVCYFKTILRAVVRHYSYMEGKNFNDVIQDAIDEVEGRKDIKPEVSIWTEPLGKALKREITLFTNKAEMPAEGEVGVSMLIQQIIDYAIYMGASDIHFEAFEDAVKVRLRKDGILATQWYLPKIIQNRLFNRIKVMGNLRSTMSTFAQDGSFTYQNIVDAGVDIRLSTVPTIHGERIAMRILDKNRRVLELNDLGIPPKEYQTFIKALKTSQGLILNVGPTGSGKTTTIYGALDFLNRDFCSIITMESPIEYQISGVSQIHVDPNKKYNFVEAFADVLRQDPDVIVLGEILDRESAHVAVTAASTGHLIFSTLHATCSAFAIPRLLSLGVDASVLSDVLRVIVAQRLLRLLCPHCKVIDELSEERLQRLGLARDDLGANNYFRARGCEHCNHRGYIGRVGCFEVLEIDDRIREMILNGNTGLDVYYYAHQHGMRSMFHDALFKAQQGYTSLDEVIYQAPIFKRV